MAIEDKIETRIVELVGFHYSEEPLKGRSVLLEQTQYLPTLMELMYLMNSGKLSDYKVILVKNDEDDLLYQPGYEFFNERVTLNITKKIRNTNEQ